MAYKMPGKYCIVPMCHNTTNNRPKLVFIRVPSDCQKRKVWLEAAHCDPSKLSQKSPVYMCQDHFNLENDTDNYMECKMMGLKQRMKANVVPHKFECQRKNNRTNSLQPVANMRNMFEQGRTYYLRSMESKQSSKDSAKTKDKQCHMKEVFKSPKHLTKREQFKNNRKGNEKPLRRSPVSVKSTSCQQEDIIIAPINVESEEEEEDCVMHEEIYSDTFIDDANIVQPDEEAANIINNSYSDSIMTTETTRTSIEEHPKHEEDPINFITNEQHHPLIKQEVIDVDSSLAEADPAELKRKLSLAHERIQELTGQLNSTEQILKTVFNEDQLYYLKHGTIRGSRWETETIRRAFQLYITCGTVGYDNIRTLHYPLPNILPVAEVTIPASQCRQETIVKLCN